MRTALATTLLCAAAGHFLPGCESGPRPGPANGDAMPAGQPPPYTEIATAHNDRIAKLQTIYADGVIEIRWRDERGGHFEQGDMELWLRLPRHTALRVEKFGEVFLWLGSDESRYWLFDRTAKQSVLYIGSHEDPVSTSGGALNVRPLALLDLMALSPLPAGSAPAPQVNWDPKHKAWVVETRGAGGPMRMFFDPQTRLPSRVETLAPTGDVALYSVLRRYESVDLEGMLPVAQPKLAEMVDIFSATESSSNRPEAPMSGTVKLAINSATGYIDPEELERVFDLDRLIRGMPPDRIEGDLPGADATADSGNRR